MKNNTPKNKQTAIQFMKSYEDTCAMIESIGNQTASEQKSLMENASYKKDCNSEGLFLMENLMDVQVSDVETNQPRFYNSPVEELTDYDKSLIVDEFAKEMSKIHKDVIDFSDIGPVATVIQDRLGYKQNLENFLTNLISTAVDTQDSQSFAHGDKPVAGMKGAVDAGTEEGGPADIAPNEVSVNAPMEMSAEVEVPVVDELVVAEPVSDMPPMGDEMVEDAPVMGDVDPVVDESPVGEDMDMGSDLGEDMGSDVADVAEEVVPVADVAPIADESPVEEKAEDKVEEKAEETEESEEKEDESEDKEEKVEDKAVMEEMDIDTQFEAIKNTLISSLNEGKKSPEVRLEAKEAPKTKKVEVSIDSVLEAIEKDEKVVVESVDKTKEITAKLEAIANGYHASENAKIEAVQKEKKIDSILESIATRYHSGEKAKLESVQKAKEVDSKLASLVESYHKSNEQAKLENVEQRKAIREKLEAESK